MERGGHVSPATRPTAARSYLDDGTGLAWTPPVELATRAIFVVDAEIIRPVRPLFIRRFGLADPEVFAQAWTRAEVWAKLADVPIATWTRRHGLVEPAEVSHRRDVGEIDWNTARFEDVVVTFGVRMPRDSEVDGADGG